MSKQRLHVSALTSVAKCILVAILLMVMAVSVSAKDNGRVVVAIPTDPDTLDPHKYVAAATGELAYNIFQGLVASDDKGKVVPCLASSWTVSPDGKSYTFTLRQDVYFHNGKKMTSGDVQYSFRRMMDKATAYPGTWVRDVVDAEATSGSTFTVKLNKVSVPFIAELVDAIIIPDGTGPDQKTAPIGTGPFRFKSWIPGQQVELIKFDKYWKRGIPKLNEVVFRIVPEPTAQMMGLKAGTIDLIPRVTGDLAAEAMKSKDLKVVTGPMNLVQLLAINNARKPFADIKVRQAILYALNRDEIIQGSAAGYGTKLGSNMSPVMKAWYVKLDGAYKPNINKSKQLLREAGYPDGFKATISLPSIYDIHVRAGEIIAAQLKKVGIDLKIEVVEWGVWLDHIYSKRDYDLTVIGFQGKLDPHAVLERYGSTYSKNFINFNSKEYDELLKKGESTIDFTDRKAIYTRLQRILSEEAASAYIQDPSMISVMKQGINGWRILPKYAADMSRVTVSK